VAAAAAEDLAAHRRAVRGFLLRLLRDDGLAEELAQEALARAASAGAERRGESAFRTWLVAIALNLARDHFRRARRRPVPVGLEAAENVPALGDPEREVLRAEMSRCILDYVARLAPRQRDAVLMHHFAGLTHREIAAALAVSEGNARVLLHRGLAALKASLARECVIDLADEVPCERR
jgi:RNA polymerase sigma-70 factor (ECF subfamily)